MTPILRRRDVVRRLVFPRAAEPVPANGATPRHIADTSRQRAAHLTARSPITPYPAWCGPCAPPPRAGPAFMSWTEPSPRRTASGTVGGLAGRRCRAAGGPDDRGGA